MSIPARFARAFAAFPPELQALVEAELAAGNGIVEISGGFPAPPAGDCLKLLRPVTTRPRRSSDGLHFRHRNSSLWGGEFTDARGFFFILEPPGAAPEASAPPLFPLQQDAPTALPIENHAEAACHSPSPLQRFRDSMTIDYEKWHDGVGYALEHLRSAGPAERIAIEHMLLSRALDDWRDVEALAALDTPNAKAALRKASREGGHAVQIAVIRYAPTLVSSALRTQILSGAIANAALGDGLSEAIDEVATFHPPAIVAALHAGIQERDGETACLLAGLLLFVHGKADETFDWKHRPFLLGFNTDDRTARHDAYLALCERIGEVAR